MRSFLSVIFVLCSFLVLASEQPNVPERKDLKRTHDVAEADDVADYSTSDDSHPTKRTKKDEVEVTGGETSVDECSKRKESEDMLSLTEKLFEITTMKFHYLQHPMVELLEKLGRERARNALDENGNSLLLSALLNDAPSGLVLMLYINNAYNEAFNFSGQSLLHLLPGWLSSMKKNNNGDPAMRLIESRMLTRICKAFSGIIDVPDAEGYTPLHYAMLHGELALAEIMVKNGATGMSDDNPAKMMAVQYLDDENNLKFRRLIIDRMAKSKCLEIFERTDLTEEEQAEAIEEINDEKDQALFSLHLANKDYANRCLLHLKLIPDIANEILSYVYPEPPVVEAVVVEEVEETENDESEDKNGVEGDAEGVEEEQENQGDGSVENADELRRNCKRKLFDFDYVDDDRGWPVLERIEHPAEDANEDKEAKEEDEEDVLMDQEGDEEEDRMDEESEEEKDGPSDCTIS